MVRALLTVLALATLPSVAAAAACGGPTTDAVAAPPQRQQFVFVVDTSGSMVGKGTGSRANILPSVKRELLRFVDKAPAASDVEVVTFDEGPKLRRQFRMPEDRQGFRAFVQGLKAEGQNTWVYRSLDQVIRRPKSRDAATNIYVLTDGEDNDPTRGVGIRGIVERYELDRGAYDWLYYITLGLGVPGDVRAAFEGVPRARAQSAAIGTFPVLSAAQVRTTALELGNLRASPTATARLDVRSQGPAFRVGLDVSPIESERGTKPTGSGAHLRAAGPLELVPNAPVRFQLENARGLPFGKYRATLCLTDVPESAVLQSGPIALTFSFFPPATYRIQDVPGGRPAGVVGVPRGTETRREYRLVADAGGDQVTAPATVGVEGLVPGLEATVNGHPAPVEVEPGQPVVLALKNTGLAPGTPVQPRLTLAAPQGAEVRTPPALPALVQPRTFWDWLSQWWPLLLLALAAALALLAALIAWLISRRPWATGVFVGPPDCQEVRVPMTGRTFDLGRHQDTRPVNGLVLASVPAGVKVVRLPADVAVKHDRWDVDESDVVEFGEKLTLRNEDWEPKEGTLAIERPPKPSRRP